MKSEFKKKLLRCIAAAMSGVLTVTTLLGSGSVFADYVSSKYDDDGTDGSVQVYKAEGSGYTYYSANGEYIWGGTSETSETFTGMPFSGEYSSGYFCIGLNGNGSITYIDSKYAVSDTFWSGSSSRTIICSANNTSKSDNVYVDHYNGVRMGADYYDIREYVWCTNADYWSMGSKGQIYCYSKTSTYKEQAHREFHFYEAGTLEAYEAGTLSGSLSDYEVTFKGVLQIKDNDYGEGYTFDQGLATVNGSDGIWVSYKTYIEKTSDSSGLGLSGSSKTWKGRVEHNPTDDDPSADQKMWWRETIWAEVVGSASAPLTLTYWSYGKHGNTINYQGNEITYTIVKDSSSAYSVIPDEAEDDKAYCATYSEYNLIDGKEIDGYYFSGWYTDESLTTKAKSTVLVNSDKQYYGAYYMKTGDVTFTKYEGYSSAVERKLTSSNNADANAAVEFVLIAVDTVGGDNKYMKLTGSDGVYEYSGYTASSSLSYSTVKSVVTTMNLSSSGTISITGLPVGTFIIREVTSYSDYDGTMDDVEFTINEGTVSTTTETSEYLLGDANLDGNINTSDVGPANSYVNDNSFVPGVVSAGTVTMEEWLQIVDIDGDDEVTYADVNIINSIAKGILSSSDGWSTTTTTYTPAAATKASGLNVFQTGSLTFIKNEGYNSSTYQRLTKSNNSDANAAVEFVLIAVDPEYYTNSYDYYIMLDGSNGSYTFKSFGTYTTNTAMTSRTVMSLKTSGNISVSGLPVGTYILREITSYDDYDGTMEDVEFTVTADTKSSVTGLNKFPTGEVTFTKYYGEDDSSKQVLTSSNYSSANSAVKFALYVKSGTTAYSLSSDTYINATGSNGEYAFSGFGSTTSYSTYTELNLSSDGTIHISGLPEGDYVLKEVSGYDNYFTGAMTDVEFTVSSSSTAKVSGMNYVEPVGSGTGNLKFTKYEGYGNGTRVLTSTSNSDANAAVEFMLAYYNGTTYQWVYATSSSDGVYTYSNFGSTIGQSYGTVFKLSSSGTITVSDLPVGEYYITEITSHDDFTGTMEDVSFTITEDSTRSVTGKNYLVTGEATFTKYYGVNDNSKQVLTFSNYSEANSDLRFVLLCTSATSWTLPSGGQYSILSGSDGEYTFSTFSVPAVYYSVGMTAVTELELSDDGTIHISGLPEGTYVLQEISGYEDYFIGAMDDIELTVTASTPATASGMNYMPTGDLEFTKYITSEGSSVSETLNTTYYSDEIEDLQFAIAYEDPNKGAYYWIFADEVSGGVYTYTGTGTAVSAGQPSSSNSYGTIFSLNSASQINVSELPTGDYKIYEIGGYEDYFSGAMKTVSFTISEDQTAEISGTNYFKSGELDFTKYEGYSDDLKQVLTYSNNDDANETVRFVVARTDLVAGSNIICFFTGSDGEYQYEGAGSWSYVTELELSSSGTINISGMPDGDYYIRESVTHDDYTGYMSWVYFTIEEGEVTKATGMNYLKTGEFTFTKYYGKDDNSKQVLSSANYSEANDDLKFVLYALSDLNAYSLSDDTYVLLSGSDGEYEFSNFGSTTSYSTYTELELADDGTIHISGLPEGTYVLQEFDGYDSYFTGAMEEIEFTVDFDASATISGMNYLPPTGDLEFTKIVTDSKGVSYTLTEAFDSQGNEDVTFAISRQISTNAWNYILADQTGDGEYEYTKFNTPDDLISPSELSQYPNAGTVFSLSSEGTLNVSNLPVGNYIIYEATGSDNYDGTFDAITFTVTADETIEVTGVNNLKTGSMTITKELTEEYYTDEEFIFEVTETNLNGDTSTFLAYVIVPAGSTEASVQIDGVINTYSYEVRELNNNWRYTAVDDETYLEVDGAEVTTGYDYVKDNSNNSMSFTFSTDDDLPFNSLFTNEGHDYWLDDGDNVTNVMEEVQ